MTYRFGRGARSPALMRRALGAVKTGGVALPTTDLLVALFADQGVADDGAGEVTAWADQDSGSGPHDATQTDATMRPEYEATGGVGSTPTLAFGPQSPDADGHLFWSAAVSAAATPVTAYFVLDVATNPTDSILVDFQSGRFLLYASRLGNVAFFDSGAASTRSIAAGTTGPQVLTYRLSAPTGEVYRARSSLGSGTYTSNVALDGSNKRLGSSVTAGAGTYDGRMAACLLYGADHDATQRAAVWDYIAATWPGYGVT